MGDRTPTELEFARRLKTARKLLGMSSHDFGPLIGCAQSMVSHYENSHRIPRMGHADRIARILGYDGLGDFLTACPVCINRPRPGTVCGTCGLPEVRVTVLAEAEQRAYARLREIILGGGGCG